MRLESFSTVCSFSFCLFDKVLKDHLSGAQQLRKLTALAEDPSLVSDTPVELFTTPALAAGAPKAFI